MIKLTLVSCLCVCFLALTSCEHYYHIYVVNKSGHNQSISILNRYEVKVDSLKFFSASEKPTAHNYKKANLYRNTLRQDSIYKFEIENDETTLLQPIGIATSVKAIIINADTVYFDSPQGFFNKEFERKWTDRFIYVIH
jgi:hypothetical protein